MTVVTQILWTSLVWGLMLGLVATGFWLVFRTNRVFHLAHGGSFVVGAFMLWYVQQYTGSLALGVATGLVAAAALGWTMERLVYSPMDRRRSGQALTLVVSAAVYLIIVNLLALVFGNNSKVLDLAMGVLHVGGFVVPAIQIVQMCVCAILLAGAIGYVRSRAGLPMLAFAGDPVKAQVMGVSSGRTRSLSIIVGSVLAAIAGMLRLLDTGISPNSGMAITLSAAVAVIVGGNGSIVGTILASFLIALLQTVTEWCLSTQWKDGVTFLLLIVVVLWRTEGIVSYRMRVEER